MFGECVTVAFARWSKVFNSPCSYTTYASTEFACKRYINL